MLLPQDWLAEPTVPSFFPPGIGEGAAKVRPMLSMAIAARESFIFQKVENWCLVCSEEQSVAEVFRKLSNRLLYQNEFRKRRKFFFIDCWS